jgi:hypothetical protein
MHNSNPSSTGLEMVTATVSMANANWSKVCNTWTSIYNKKKRESHIAHNKHYVV